MLSKEIALPYPKWFYETLMQNVLPRQMLTKRPPEKLELSLSIPTNHPQLTPIVQKVSKAKMHDYSAVMRELFDIVIVLMLEHRVESQKIASLTEPQAMLLKTYLKYILTPSCIDRMFRMQAPTLAIHTEDMLDLSKRRDETLKKVLSISLKLIYREYMAKHKINQSLNPRKYVKRSEVNRRIFKEYFDREPMLIKRRSKDIWEHNLLFFIKEGVTEEWFEAVLGVRHGYALHSVPTVAFLEKIYTTLRSEQLLQLYKRKIVSMVKKIFTVEDKYKPEAGSDSKIPEFCYYMIQSKLEPCKKKPKTALSVEQFKTAVKIALTTLDKFRCKYGIKCELRLEDFGNTADNSHFSADQPSQITPGMSGDYLDLYGSAESSDEGF